MKSSVLWRQKVVDEIGVKQCVYDTCFDPEGKHILVTGGNHVLVYSAKDGSLIHTLKDVSQENVLSRLQANTNSKHVDSLIEDKYSEDTKEDPILKKIRHNPSAKLKGICSQHFLMEDDGRLQSYNFDGIMEREWNFPGKIACVQVIDGVSGKECVLVAFHNGQVMRLFLHINLASEILNMGKYIDHLYLNHSRDQIACITNTRLLYVMRLFLHINLASEILNMGKYIDHLYLNHSRDQIACTILNMGKYIDHLYLNHSRDQIACITNTRLLYVYSLGKDTPHHSDAIQRVRYNPVSNILASCATSDFTIWSAENKSLEKHKLDARITCCAWNFAGTYLAIGLANGMVSVRDINCEEKLFIKADSPSLDRSVWALAWSPIMNTTKEVLCVSDWSGELTFYNNTGHVITPERPIRAELLSLQYFCDGHFLLGGEGKKCRFSVNGEHRTLYLRADCLEPWYTWMTMVACRLYLSEVRVSNVLTERTVRVKCPGGVCALFIYRNKMGVQMSDKVVVYEMYVAETTGMHSSVYDTCFDPEGKHILVTGGNHVLVYNAKDGSLIHTLKAQWFKYFPFCSIFVMRLFLHINLASEILNMGKYIDHLYLNHSRDQIACITNTRLLYVYSLGKDTPQLYHEMYVDSVAWNSQVPDMFCYSNDSHLSIRTGSFPPHQQTLSGKVLCLIGSKLFVLKPGTWDIELIQIALSIPMYQYIENTLYSQAYTLACLGVTQDDWKQLAIAAAESFQFTIALKCFRKLQMLRHIDLIGNYLSSPNKNDEREQYLLLGDLLALDNKFKKAAKLYVKGEQPHRAVTMYSDLRMFDLAQEYLGAESKNVDQKLLLKKKAEWAEHINEPKTAADMYLSAGEIVKVIEIYAQQGWHEKLVQLARQMASSETTYLTSIAEHLETLHKYEEAGEIYLKLGQKQKIIKLHAAAGQWEDALSLATGELETEIYLQYSSPNKNDEREQYLLLGDLLALDNKFKKAAKLYVKGEQPHRAVTMYSDLRMFDLAQEMYVDSVAWNSQVPDMFCYSNDSHLSIRTGSFPPHQQTLSGKVLCLIGSKLFVLKAGTWDIELIQIALSIPMYQYIENTLYSQAYTLACLGVTQDDWKQLAIAAAESFQFAIALKCFRKLQMLRHIDLISNYLVSGTSSAFTDGLVQLARQMASTETTYLTSIAEHLETLHKYEEAGEIYLKLGQKQKIIKLHAAAGQWEDALSLATGELKAEIYLQYAQWLAEHDQFLQAQQAFHNAGKTQESLRVLSQMIDNSIDETRFQDTSYYYWLLANQYRSIDLPQSQAYDQLANIYYTYNIVHKYCQEPFTSYKPDVLFNEYLGAESKNVDQKLLLKKKAEWAEHINEPKTAADMYLSAGEIVKVIEIYAQQGWHEKRGAVTKIMLNHAFLTIACCWLFLAPLSLGDVYLHAAAGQWEDALSLATGELKAEIYLQYAQWLAEHDQFLQAQQAFHNAGKTQESLRVLSQMIDNSIHETRFQDTSYYYWLLANQYRSIDLPQSQTYDQLANIYYTYNIVHKYCQEPFTSYKPDVLFNVSRYALFELKSLKRQKLKGVSQFSILHTLIKQAKILGANKLANQMLEKLSKLYCNSSNLRDTVDASIMNMKTKQYHDDEHLLIICYSCSTHVPLNSSVNACLNCKQSFVYSFCTFEVLPLVEFQVKKSDGTPGSLGTEPREEWTQIEDNYEALQIQPLSDPFITMEGSGMVQVDEETLSQMEPGTVVICKWPPPLQYRYYRNLLPEFPVLSCETCFRMYHKEDFEMEKIQRGVCPFCRT
ncbi:intraflagellar transport protein 122 homolog [Diaphorina citri]|uniref:Intraflagellar transport protein 122 homolog n=1 Tax=Diaphorina citri TaxID=121845 RepID=A0A3Q0JA16_DIACI|nr:intraflagellar transport protein 122 homolog [Diaphorina citri]